MYLLAPLCQNVARLVIEPCLLLLSKLILARPFTSCQTCVSGQALLGNEWPLYCFYVELPAMCILAAQVWSALNKVLLVDSD
jgi:hypothetical protein